MTKLGSGVKTMSIEENKLSNMSVAFLTVSFNPNCGVTLSVFIPSNLVLSLQNQLSFFVLKLAQLRSHCSNHCMSRLI